jgi:hypothetical protein
VKAQSGLHDLPPPLLALQPTGPRFWAEHQAEATETEWAPNEAVQTLGACLAAGGDWPPEAE